MPIFPNTDSFDLKLCGKKDENNARLKIRRTQFPLVPAYACTVHRAQGKTLKTVMGNFKIEIK